MNRPPPQAGSSPALTSIGFEVPQKLRTQSQTKRSLRSINVPEFVIRDEKYTARVKEEPVFCKLTRKEKKAIFAIQLRASRSIGGDLLEDFELRPSEWREKRMDNKTSLFRIFLDNIYINITSSCLELRDTRHWIPA
jgi:hypothetical protein